MRIHRRNLLLGGGACLLTAACGVRSGAGSAMTFGSSAFTAPLVEDYHRQVRELGIQSVFVYQPDAASWSDLCRAVPDQQDIWLSVATTDVDALVADIPTDRVGKVYLHYQQEPHDNMDFAAWAAGSRGVFERSRGHPAIVPSAEFAAYAFLNEPDGRWFLDEVRCYGFSSFADIRVDNGHAVASTDPVRQLDELARWAKSVDATWSVAAVGFPLPVTHQDDTESSRSRAAWTYRHITTARQLGALHWQWFNVLWTRQTPALDYRIEADPVLSSVWEIREVL